MGDCLSLELARYLQAFSKKSQGKTEHALLGVLFRLVMHSDGAVNTRCPVMTAVSSVFSTISHKNKKRFYILVLRSRLSKRADPNAEGVCLHPKTGVVVC